MDTNKTRWNLSDDDISRIIISFGSENMVEEIERVARRRKITEHRFIREMLWYYLDYLDHDAAMGGIDNPKNRREE